MTRDWLINIIVTVVLMLWSTSVLMTLVDHSYTPPPTVHLVMMAVVGALFGAKVVGQLESDNRNDRNDRNR